MPVWEFVEKKNYKHYIVTENIAEPRSSWPEALHIW
jgi:hypothetical protein